VAVPFSHFISGTALVEIEGRCIQGLPLFHGGTTDAKGVAGALGPSVPARRLVWSKWSPGLRACPATPSRGHDGKADMLPSW
jgi:hypothetical protein